jgi:succinate dehydrogenase / fumarate reductase cytochrome b subunit
MLPREGLLWIIRAVLVLSLIGHLYAAFTLWSRAQHARSHKYVVRKAAAATLSSRTMRWGGVTILVFVIWHLLHFTIVKVNPEGGETDDPYTLVVDSFSTWWMTLIYLVALGALAMHLRHGVWSASQTLGLTNSARSRERANFVAVALAVLIAGGFALVPLSILFGIVD